MENNYKFPISHNKFLEITSCTSEKSRGPVNTAKRLCGVSYINYFEEEIFKFKKIKVKLKINDAAYYAEDNSKGKNSQNDF